MYATEPSGPSGGSSFSFSVYDSFSQNACPKYSEVMDTDAAKG